MGAAAEKVFLTNSRPRLLHLPDVLKRNDKGEVIIGLGNGRMVPPSAPRDKDKAPLVTAVPRAEWDEIKNHRILREWIRLGWLAIVESSDYVAPSKDKITITEYNVKTATLLVEGEGDAALLRDWLKEETRDEMKEIIKVRLAEISKPVVAAAKK